MGYFKNKTRNQMTIKTLEMMAQLKLFLLDEPEYASTLPKRVPKSNSRVQTSPLNELSSIEMMNTFDSVILGEQVFILTFVLK